MKRVLFVVRGDATVPSCRFRAYQFSEPLRALGVAAEYFVEGRGESPVDWVRTSFNLMRRLARERYDAVVYQKRLQAERLYLIRAINPNVWYDFDDAVYLGHERRFRKTIRAAGGVIAGNGELASRALQHSSRVEIIPTTVELPGVYSRPDPEGPLRISWVGTAGNLPYLDPVFEALDRVRRGGIEAELHVLTEKPECVPDRDGVVSGRWSTEAEAGAFNRCHLGVMPLLDDAWSRGEVRLQGTSIPVVRKAGGVFAGRGEPSSSGRSGICQLGCDD